ncbi:exonuclease domain-containing protein [Mycobacterium sp. URHB0044]|uniref:exonuclease domain-containing protein n=1 Tax=Mycobacterium sp. URHB0044 TaxID=1380386 RepID=UPI0009DD9AD4|nr:exonuclease domain-containing protein [Mycobacterium sp. URHB0044]
MTVTAGWYPDPSGEALLRWWDGFAWTKSVHHAATEVPAAQSNPVQRLAHLLSDGECIAVVDVETTGLYNVDRVVEVAVVTVDRDGTIVDEFETLVNPLRDVGPTWIHGIDATMVRHAPTFADVAQHVACRVDGAVVAGHNVRFDTRILTREFERAGIDVDWGAGLDTLSVTSCKLGQACADYGISLNGQHRALVDARATAQLMLTLANSLPADRLPVVARPLSVTSMRVCRRDGYVHADPPTPYLTALARGIHSSIDVAPYVGLLDLAVADLRLTAAERGELHCLAGDLGLDDRAIARAHREFLNGLIDAAVEDSIVTDDEHDQLCRAAALLDIDLEHVARRTDSFRATTKVIELMAGLSVCFTGAAQDPHGRQVDRAQQTSLAEQHGLVVTKSVTKKSPDLVVAADGDSRSEKARKARENGIPVATFSAFVDALRTGESLTVALLSSSGLALVCVDCGDSWLAARRVSQPLCAACSSASLLDAKPGKRVTA